MSEIIYVDPTGEAHTVEQTHEMAIAFNELWDGTFRSQIIKVANALSKAFREVAKAIWEAWKGISSGVLSIVKRIEIKKREKKGDQYYWQKIIHNQDAECHLKRGSKSRTNIINMKRLRQFKRSQHQRRT